MVLVNLPAKMNFKKIAIAAVSVSILVPVLVLAQQQGGATTTGGVLCKTLTGLYPKVNQMVQDRDAKVIQKRTEITARIQERWMEQDGRLSDKRDEWDANRAEHFLALEERFEGDAEKQAVISFGAAVEAAVAARKIAMDAAIAGFRTGIQQAKDGRQTAIDAAKNAYRLAVTAAYEKAKTDCAGGVAPATVRQNLKDALTAAKNKYQADYQALDKFSVSMDQLIAARKAAIEKAIQDFKAAVEKARDEFKAAVGQEPGSNQKELACTNSGGTVTTSSCCKSVSGFPNSCLIGACGCSPDNSHDIKTCDCGEGKCFNGTSCVAVGE